MKTINDKITFFTGGSTDTKPSGTITIKNVIENMYKTEKSKATFDRLRILKENNEKEYIKLKSKLPYITINGQFTYRNNASLVLDTYTWLCPIDIDYKDNLNVNMDMIMNILTSDDSVLFCAKSPSGKGLKAIIRLKENAYKIEDHYKMMCEIYKKLEIDLGCSIDYAQGKLSQPFFLTFDPDAYVNFNATELDISYKLPEKINNENIYIEGDVIKKDYLLKVKYDEILNLTDNFWNQIGAIAFTLGGWYKAGHFTFSDTEIKTKLEEAVNLNDRILDKKQKYKQIADCFKNGFEKPIYIINHSQIIDDEFDIENPLSNTPTIPQKVYDALPNLLQKMCNQYSDERERDVFLTSEIVALSSLFDNVYGNYYGEIIYPNLYSYVLAPAASAKGTIKMVKETLNKIIHELRLRHKQKIISITDPKAKLPKEKTLLISANTSTSAFYSQLEANDGIGLIFETEADVLASTFKNEWGDYNTILRKALHNEFLSVDRKEGSIQIDNPKIAVCLSGTISSAKELIKNSENGLFSRFLYYIFEGAVEFKNPFSVLERNTFFNSMSNEIYELSEYYKFYKPLLLCTEKQGNKFIDFFNDRIDKLRLIHDNEDITGVLKRYGTLTYKIAMVLTLIDEWENQLIISDNSNKIFIKDENLNTAFELMNIYIQHMELILVNLDKKENIEIHSNKTEKLIKYILSIKGDFKSSDIFDKAKSYNISVSTCQKKLSKLVKDGKIKKKGKLIYYVV